MMRTNAIALVALIEKIGGALLLPWRPPVWKKNKRNASAFAWRVCFTPLANSLYVCVCVCLIRALWKKATKLILSSISSNRGRRMGKKGWNLMINTSNSEKVKSHSSHALRHARRRSLKLNENASSNKDVCIIRFFHFSIKKWQSKNERPTRYFVELFELKNSSQDKVPFQIVIGRVYVSRKFGHRVSIKVKDCTIKDFSFLLLFNPNLKNVKSVRQRRQMHSFFFSTIWCSKWSWAPIGRKTSPNRTSWNLRREANRLAHPQAAHFSDSHSCSYLWWLCRPVGQTFPVSSTKVW